MVHLSCYGHSCHKKSVTVRVKEIKDRYKKNLLLRHHTQSFPEVAIETLADVPIKGIV
jgi:hypothetical protein